MTLPYRCAAISFHSATIASGDSGKPNRFFCIVRCVEEPHGSDGLAIALWYSKPTFLQKFLVDILPDVQRIQKRPIQVEDGRPHIFQSGSHFFVSFCKISTLSPLRMRLVVRTAHILPHMEQLCLSEAGTLS